MWYNPCMKTDYRDQYFSILGDSISTFEGYSEPKEAVYYNMGMKLSSGVYRCADTWWGRVIDSLGAKLLVNNSIAGSTVTRHPLCQVPSYGCSDERTAALHRADCQPDSILVFLGTNDRGQSISIGDEKEGESFFLPAYRSMLKKLKENYPKAEIWCLTLSPLGGEDERKGIPTREYCAAIRACATEYGGRTIDLDRNIPPYATMDGLHPDYNGMTAIADAVLAAMTENR